MSLTILHIDTERSWRGGQQQVFSLVKGLHKKGVSNVVVVRAGGELQKRLSTTGVRVVPLPLRGEWDLFSAYRIRRLLRESSIDVVHAHSGHAVSMAALAVMGSSVPAIATRRVDFHVSGNPFSRWKYRRLTRVVAISTAVRSVLLEDGLPSSQVDMIPSGVDFSRFNGVSALSRASLGVPAEAIVIGHIAALVPHKDPVTFVRALYELRKTHPNVVGIMVGEGPLRSTLEEERTRWHLTDHLWLPGFKPNPLDYVAAFDVFCSSSSEEGLGTSILDAMALRVPVVATRAGGIPDMVKEKKTGWLSPIGDARALAQALAACLEETSRWPDITQNAYECAQSFSADRMVQSYDDLYRRLRKSVP